MQTQIKTIVRGVAIVIGLIYGFALYKAGLGFDTKTQKLLALLPAIFAGLVWAFDLWLWKIPKISPLLGHPKVYGTWLATLTPSEGSHIPDGGNWGPIYCAVVIEQTFLSTSVHLLTDESSSNSTAVEFVKRDQSKKRQRLVYTYANAPQQKHQPRSNPHSGASEFDVVGMEPATMSGTYWTARLTAGDMHLHRLDKKTDYPDLAAIRVAAERAGTDWP